jgi:membrane-bound serine protease (ClpP class)
MKQQLTTLLLLISAMLLSAQPDSLNQVKIFRFDIDRMIAPPSWHTTKKAIETAENENVDLIIIKMNTYGGTLDAADSIRTKILDCPIPVYVFIDKNAASAGALISIACDSIYMAPGSSIGAATVVDQTGKPMPDKYQSYMRSLMRSTAEVNGRNPKIAEAMVDPSVRVPGVSDSGKVLTFTPSEAVKNGYCEAEVNSIEDILRRCKIDSYEMVEHRETISDKIIGFLINPFVSGILIMIIIGGIYFELQTPGVGFPLAAAAVAALLYFAPLYIEGLATHWEIVAFVVGLILIAVEIFVIPGFGITGILGIVLMVAGLTMSMVKSTGPGMFDIDFQGLTVALFVVIIAVTVSVFLSIFITKKLFSENSFAHLGLYKTQQREQGYTSASDKYEAMKGKEGKSLTKLRPAGKVVVENDTFDAIAEIGFVEKDEDIVVTGYRNAQLVVKRKG